MKGIALLVAGGLLLAIMPPAAEASDDGPFPCDKDPLVIILAIVENLVVIVNYVIARGTAAINEAALKAKCSAYELVGICADDDSLIQLSTQSTGATHPHRGRCYEYVFVPGADAPNASSCPAGKKVEHLERFGADVHTCVPIQKLN